MDITADPYPDGVKPYSGFGTGVPILIGKTIVDPPYTTVICYAGIRGVGVNFRTTLLLWDPQYISDIEGMKCIINKTIQWLIGGAVPVELTAFNVTSKNGEVNLNWITASETNNKGFEIERSNEDEFEKVGFVSGNGTTTEQHEYYFKDEAPPGHYSYRLKQIDHNGFFDYSKIVEVEVKQPNVYSLNQNYPNPFNPNTTFSYSLANIGQVTIKVFNILGKEVQTLVNEFKPAGTYHMEWNAYNLPSGIYFYQMNSGSFIETKKMILLK